MHYSNKHFGTKCASIVMKIRSQSPPKQSFLSLSLSANHAGRLSAERTPHTHWAVPLEPDCEIISAHIITVISVKMGKNLPIKDSRVMTHKAVRIIKT